MAQCGVWLYSGPGLSSCRWPGGEHIAKGLGAQKGEVGRRHCGSYTVTAAVTTYYYVSTIIEASMSPL